MQDRRTRRRPRVFYGWYIVGASFLTNMLVAGIYWQGFQVLFLPILREFRWSRTTLSTAFTLRQMETGIVAPVLGFAVDRVGPRRVIIVSAVLVGLGLITLSRASSLWTFYLYFLIAAIGAGGVSHSITWPVAIAQWFRRRRGLALGMGTSGPLLSGVLLLALAWAVEQIGWRSTVALSGIIIWGTIIPLGMIVRDSPEPYGLLPDGDDPEEEPSSLNNLGLANGRRTDRDGHTVREALRDHRFWVLSLFLGIISFGTSGFNVHQIPYFESVGFSSSQAAATVAIVFLISGIGRTGVGALADVIDIRLVLGTITAMNVAAWVYLRLVHVSSLTMAIPFTFLYGVSFGASVALRPLLLTRLFGTRALGSLAGLIQISGIVSGMVAPVVMGRIFDVQGEYTQSLYIFAVVVALGLPTVPFIKQAPSRTLAASSSAQGGVRSASP